MDEASMNRYEKQLYTVFKTFDVDNEEALDRSAVHKLCDALQLEDRGAALVNTLFERRSDRVTFAQFRNGLLAVLGGAGGDTSRAVPAPSAPQPSTDPPQPDTSSRHSDEDSSGREVAPKFVFGSKKYGRRSRPSRSGPTLDEAPSPRSSSASRLDTDDKRAKQRMRCRRSASAMESRDDTVVFQDVNETFEHDRRIDRDEALALCRGLNMDGIDRRLVERIFDDAGTTDTTVGEFFDRLNSSLTTTMEEATREVRSTPTIGDSEGDAADEEATSGLPSELVLEAWERAGVQQPRRLLAELGFPAAALHPPDLERALDDELRALPEPPQDACALLLRAALALCRLRLDRSRRRAELATAERDKLRGDVAEANRHAGILAQEVDESHARIEAELKASLKRAEARHAEMTRQTTAEIGAERERAAATLARLEAEVARRIDLEGRLRGEINGLRERTDEAEARAAAADSRCADTAREAARLAAELRAAQARAAEARDSAAPAAPAAELRRLQRECQQLRDRNDELCAALEAHARWAAPGGEGGTPGGEGGTPGGEGDLSAELHSFLAHEHSEECDSSPVSLERSSGHVDAVSKLGEICASVRDIPRPAPRAHAAAQTDAPEPCQLLDAERRHDDEKRKLASLIKDLEGSLEQMKAEYDKCEDYWSSKLDEERDAWAEEQRLGDERLADLVAKIGEYERQFAPAAPLPTIDERLSLEAQVTDLEDEFQRYRRDKEAELAAQRADCARLAERLQRLEAERLQWAEAERLQRAEAERLQRAEAERLQRAEAERLQRAEAEREAGAGRAAREVRELRARTARAEAAARRLTARLAAADLLVKDLYVENCQLAHRRPL